MHGFGCGKDYLECISKTYDVAAISEHWLFPQEIDKIKKCMPGTSCVKYNVAVT